MSVHIFIDIVWTEICKHPCLTQSYIQYNVSAQRQVTRPVKLTCKNVRLQKIICTAL